MNNSSHTFESVWAALQESNRFLTEKQAETNRILTEKFAELKESQAETDRQIEKVSQQIAKTEKLVGGISTNNGLIAEEYFFNSFEKGQKNFFGERFDDIKKNLKGLETDDEYDIVMLNGHSTAIVEVKHKAHENDLTQILTKADTFRRNFQKCNTHKIYIGLASMAFYKELEEECKKQGIAIIKQIGDKVVIFDENLKTF
ncbi:MAG: hypothetical protein LBE91_22170 [Tannerella sp.]|jgi:hypothetical protein|nr:hypothetical protein [Tannerella sp.]